MLDLAPLESLSSSLLVAASHALHLAAPQPLSSAYFLNDRLARSLDALADLLTTANQASAPLPGLLVARRDRMRILSVRLSQHTARTSPEPRDPSEEV
jgi:hypothetical protein